MKLWQMLSWALLLRCPSCGQGKLFRVHFQMFQHCECCGRKYDQAPGYFLGSIYINYALTALLVAIGYPILVFGYGYSEDVIVWIAFAFCLVFPLCFFRYARSLWLGIDQLFDPMENQQDADETGML